MTAMKSSLCALWASCDAGSGLKEMRDVEVGAEVQRADRHTPSVGNASLGLHSARLERRRSDTFNAFSTLWTKVDPTTNNRIYSAINVYSLLSS